MVSGVIHAQDTTSADGLFAAAREAAYEQKNNTNAIRLAKKALAIAPAYTDVVVFTGRVYAWSKNYDSSLHYMQQAIAADHNNEDAYIAYSDLEMWNAHNEKALAVTEEGLSYVPASRELLIRKVKILAAMRRYLEAYTAVSALADGGGGNAEVRAMMVMLRDQSCRNKVSIKLDGMWFDTSRTAFSIANDDDARFAPQRFASVELVTATRIGPWVVRANVANRFKKPGLQYEMDLYPKLSKTFYMYLNAGYGDHLEVFPRWRAGTSLFANLPHAYEAEAGVRYLYYTNDIFFYTGYVGKYISKFLVGARTYLAPSGNKFSNTTGATIRYYFGGADDFVNLVVMKGLPIDDRRINVDLFNAGTSRFAELSAKCSIKKVNIISLNLSWLQNKLPYNRQVEQYQVGIGYTKRFL
ncbi:hypothetical protein GCM10023093_01850 [Nemorincola caseinilytica]|uniref:YaiO beta-barrel domain-containing protein n=1 Tax=Nemorincola caseinilytica TaxID=2054315 RepID=A0ABP8N227_9BACT